MNYTQMSRLVYMLTTIRRTANALWRTSPAPKRQVGARDRHLVPWEACIDSITYNPILECLLA